MPNNLCIYFSDTGGGHRSAAEALEAAVAEILAESGSSGSVSVIKDSVAEKCHPLNKFFSQLYNYLLRHNQPLMKYYYWFLHMFRPESGVNLFLTKEYFQQLLLRDKPTVMISVHPMQQYVLAAPVKQLSLNTKFVVVVTDPNADLWRAWACPYADLTIVPNELVRNKLIEYGLQADKVVALGMAVHPDFLKPPTLSRAKFLSHLGLSADMLTVCINAGWAGGGNMLNIYRELSRVDRPLQALFLCGHNTRMYEQAMAAAAESDVPTAVLPFHDCMSDLMASVDLMVTKAGGLTTYQALARRLPIVFDVTTEAMPQEKGTVDMLVEQKMAQSLNRASDIVDIIESFEPNPERFKCELPSAYEFNLTDGAVFEIARRVLQFFPLGGELVSKSNSGAEVTPCDLPPKSTVNQVTSET